MIDRPAREKLASALRAYMAEEIAAFKFDEMAHDISDATEDETVGRIVRSLWCFYDDLTDHRIVGTKVVWDYFARLLLVLESDGEIESVRTARHWGARQIVATCCLVSYAVLAWFVGLTGAFFLCAVPFGVMSMLLAWWRRVEEGDAPHPDMLLEPFASVGGMMAARRRVPGFTKPRWPSHVSERRIRPRFFTAVYCVQWGVFWLLLGPLALLLQALPTSDWETDVRLPQAASA